MPILLWSGKPYLTLTITDKQKWWDNFLTCIRSNTVAYTKRKYFIENSTRDRLRRDLAELEAAPTELLTSSQISQYEYLKGKLTATDNVFGGSLSINNGNPTSPSTSNWKNVARNGR